MLHVTVKKVSPLLVRGLGRGATVVQFSTGTEATAAAAAAEAPPTHKPKPFSAIPGDWKSTLPIIGAMPIFLPYVHKETGGMTWESFLQDCYHNYAKETGVYRFGPPGDRVVICFTEDYLKVIKGEGKYPIGILEGSWPIQQYNEKYLNGLQNPFTSRGEHWRMGRMALNPHIFNKQTALSYLEAVNETAKSAAIKFEEYASQGKLNRFCELAAMDMFTAASLGVQLNSVAGDPEGLEFADKVVGALATMGRVSLQCPYSKFDMLKFKFWDRFVSDWQTARKATQEMLKLALEEGKSNGKGIMHGFLKDRTSGKISDDEATEMALILTFAASDTTSSLIYNVLTNLSRNPDVQQKVRAEMKEELGGKDYDPELAKLKYFGQVLKESQRLTPPLPLVNIKHKISNDVVLNGYNVEAGTSVMFSQMALAQDETYAGPDPSKFRPERYSDEAVAARKDTKAEFLDHPIACQPFGFGARMCVGSRVAKLEYTSLICRLIQDYHFEYDEDNSAPTIRVTHVTTMDHPCPTYEVTKLNC